MSVKKSKVVIVGAGNVGSTTAYTMLNQGLCEELVLLDMNQQKAEGEVMDMQHSVYFMNRNIKIHTGDYTECRDADIVVITAAAPMDPNATTRLELLAPSKKVMKSIVGSIMENGFNGILLVISNPVDIMTYYAWKLSGLPRNQVIGSGTTLDMARLSCELSNLFDMDAKSVSCYIIGEHGDSEVVSWDSATIGGKRLLDIMKDNKGRTKEKTLEQLREDTMRQGWEIYHRKGNTCYGIAASVTSIVKSILFDENRILPVCVYLDGEYGLRDVYLSVPAILNRNGCKEIVEINLTKEEQAALQHSSQVVQSYYEALR